jgi:hypothetical protein
MHLSVIRYRLDIEVEYGPAQTTFVFWDRECNELLGKTAAELHAEMVQVLKFYSISLTYSLLVVYSSYMVFYLLYS